MTYSPKLLLFATLCWAAPLSAQQRPAAAGQPKHWHSRGCPKTHISRPVIISSNERIGEGSQFEARRQAFLP